MRKYTLIMSFQILHKNGMQQLPNYSIFIHLPSHTIWWHWCIVYVLQLINKCNNMMKINTCIVQTKCNIAKSSPIYRIMNELSLLFYSLLSLHTHIKKPQTNISIVHNSQARHLLCTSVTWSFIPRYTCHHSQLGGIFGALVILCYAMDYYQ